MEKLTLKADDAFKELFAHEIVRKQFLSDVLDISMEQIKSVRLANPFLRRTFRRQKQGIMDIAMVLNNNTRIDIEMQVYRQKHYTQRKLYYLARMYTDELMTGEKYKKLCRCISISLVDFDLLPDAAEYHKIYRLRDKAGRDLTDLWEIHIIELNKELTGNRVDDWIRLFNATSQEEVDQIAEKNERMRDVAEVVRHMGLIRTIRWFYDGYWRAKRDRWDEDEYVRDEGIAIGKSDNVLQLLNILGEVPQDLREKITSERNIETLDRWHLSAARADSILQFREKEDL